jgi:DNA polymerase-3 subunit alpha
VESSGMRHVLTSLRPTAFEDIVAVLSLYRPGPMQFIDNYVARKHGEEEIKYIHPSLEPILEETYGIIVYQEQIIRILTDIAGYSSSDADLMRRAVGKKKEKEIRKHREIFIQGCIEFGGIESSEAEEIFAAIEFFANYGFNKAHAASYAVLTCQTAYLKAKYPVEYLAAMLSVERNNSEKIAFYVAESRRLGIEVLSPNINCSRLDFTIENVDTASCVSIPFSVKNDVKKQSLSIRFGLGAIKNVGEGPVQTVLEARDAGGHFRDLDDFCERVDLRQLNRRVLESLIKAGAMDVFGRREQLLEVIDRMMEKSAEEHAQTSQLNMFSMDAFLASEANIALNGSLPDVEEIPTKQLLLWEKELIGLYVSDHPLQHVSDALSEAVTASCGEIGEERSGQKIVIGGIVTSVRTILTRREKQMAFVQIEDLQGSIEVVVFPKLYEDTQELWEEDKILVVTGTVDCKNGSPKVLADSVQDHLILTRAITEEDEQAHQEPDDKPSFIPPREQVQLLQILVNRTGNEAHDMQCLQRVHDLLLQYPGDGLHVVAIVGNGKKVNLRFPGATTRNCPELKDAIEQVLGTGSVQIIE